MKNHASFRRLARLPRLAGDRSGATAVEFALVVPVLMLFMMAIIEFSLAMFAQGLMETATFNASRLGKTGYVPAGQSRQQAIMQMVTQKTAVLLNATKLTMTTKVYSDFSQVGQPEPYTDSNHNGQRDAGEVYTDINGNGQWDADMGIAGLGGADDIVVYTVNYPWTFFTPMIGTLFGPSRTLTLSTRAVVKNEPYDD